MMLRRVGYPAVTSYAIVPVLSRDSLAGNQASPGGSGGVSTCTLNVNSCPAQLTRRG
jgi:hypothetical protein